MANQNISKAGKVAIALGVIAGLLSISRAIYNYTQHGDLDTGKLALGIGVPLLVYVLVMNTARTK